MSQKFLQAEMDNSSIIDEAKWSWRNAVSMGLIDEDDTSVLFQSWDRLKLYTQHLIDSFSHPNALHAVAIKTQPHPKVLERIVDWGLGLEAASMEEVKKALNAGVSPNKIVFDSPVKTKKEILYCHEKVKGIRLNVNSIEELNRIPDLEVIFFLYSFFSFSLNKPAEEKELSFSYVLPIIVKSKS